MSKLIPMDEAANILGMTVEQISELRSNNEIFGYRDGSNWKFKMSELERVAGELDIKLNIPGAAKVADDLSESFGFDLSESSADMIIDDESSAGMIEDLDSADYAEDSSVELFQSPLSAGDDDAISLSDDSDSIDLADSGLLKQKGTSKSLDQGEGALRLDSGSSDIHASDEDVIDGAVMENIEFYLDPFNNGIMLGVDDFDTMLLSVPYSLADKKHLPATNVDIVKRVMNNLIHALFTTGEKGIAQELLNINEDL